MIRHALIALFLSATMALSQGDPVQEFSANDPVMNAAMAEARETLPLFLENVVDAEGYGQQGTYLKVAFAVNSAQMDNEIIWVGPFADWGDGTFAGLLSNEPVAMPSLRAGDRVDFTRDMIRDWSYRSPDGKGYGNYTTRVVAEQLPKADRDQILSSLSPDPVPAAWK